MNPGKLDRKIILQTPTESRGAQGGFTTTWANLATVWAQFIPNGSRDFYAASQIHSEARAAFRIRYYSGITGGDRISYDGKLWDILGEPIEEGRRRFLLIAAKYAEGVTP